MHNLVNAVKTLVDKEYNRASALHGGTHASDHEAFAVILEELEETRNEVNRIDVHTHQLWDLVKAKGADQNKQIALQHIYNTAVLAACEAIQVAAMAHKGKQTIISRREQK